MTLTVSVVVATYMRAGRLESLVTPLLADPATTELIVVVDGCDDGSLEALEAMAVETPRLRPVWRPNGGEMAARQTGLEHSTGDVVLFLDDDVRPMDGLVSGHARAHEGRHRTLVLGGMPTRAPEGQARERGTTRLYAEEYEGNARTYRESGAAVLDRLWAGNFSLRREDALEVGLAEQPPPRYYFVDQHFGLRLQEAGFSAVFVPELVATHLHERSLRQFRRDALSQGRGLHELHTAHPEQRRKPTAAYLSQDLPTAPWLAVRLAWQSPLISRLVERLLMTACWVAGHAGSQSVERRCLLLLRLVAQARGARRAQVESAAAGPLTRPDEPSG